MVDISINWQRYTFKVSGEPVAMELLPLKVSQVFAFMQINADTPDARQISIMEDVFESNVRNIENLMVNGELVEPKAIPTITQLMGLCGDIMLKLTEISQMPEADKKKSVKQSTLPKAKEATTT